MVEAIDWTVSYLKSSPYGVQNFIRFSKEAEQPPAATGVGAPLVARQVSSDGDNLRVTVDIGDDGTTGAAAPLSPLAAADAEPLGEVV